MTGKVYLLGAGPGKVGLMTIEARQLLEKAEVLIYDALVAPELLNFVNSDCLQIDVGKRGGRISTPQSRINRLLVDYCKQGKQVVRLKSGDPLLFGRANQEIAALTEANCPFAVIPGISSALAAPLLAGIPLTDTQLSKCLVILTGHQPDSLNWRAIAQIETIVVLMGSKNLPEIVAHLLKYGRSPQEAIAIIKAAGTLQQQVWQGTLEDIVAKTSGMYLSPAVIVIGKVIEAQFMSESLPLTGKNILVTRAAEQSSQFTYLLQKEGAQVWEMPALVITPPSNWQPLDEAIASLGDFHWLILTSANAVTYFCQRLQDTGRDLRALGNLKIAVVGKKTAATLAAYHLQPDFIPPDFIADSLVTHFPDIDQHPKILFPRVESGGRDVLVKDLRAKGATVVEVAAYESRCPENIDPGVAEALANHQIDIITFASSKTVSNFYQLLQGIEDTLESILADTLVASIGPQTSEACRQFLGKVDIEAQTYTLSGLTDAIIKHISATSS